MLISGLLGFIYEELFYRIDLGYFVKRGSTFGPIIPIYAFGGFFIVFLTYRFKDHPLLVVFLNIFITGILEYATGYFLFEFKGIRLWDYNTEIWNFGNINGYICFRSVLLFGISSLFLIYVLVPFLIKIVKKYDEKKISFISYLFGIIFLIDMILYGVIK